jgi:hypothetical protein
MLYKAGQLQAESIIAVIKVGLTQRILQRSRGHLAVACCHVCSVLMLVLI